MTNFLDKLLNFYNITYLDYLNLNNDITISDIPTIKDFKNGLETQFFLKEQIFNNKKILVYGDYDADGMLATSILIYTFKKINFNNYGFYVPNRYKDGYGLNEEKVKLFKEKQYDLIICVDNGISQFGAINLANQLGIQIIICDHHDLKENKYPNTKYIIHPFLSKFQIVCSGAFTSYILGSSLLKEYDPYILSLACISTFTDMMEIKGYNKNIAKLGIKEMNKYHFKQISLLSENKIIDENIIGGYIGPKINSVGRLVDDLSINNVVKFFISDDLKEQEKYFNYIKNLNDQRKELTNNFNIENVDLSTNCIFEIIDQKEGLLGLYANKLLDKYKKPVFLFTKDSTNPDNLKGSIRVLKKYNIIELLEENKNLLEKFGGHEVAAGLTIKLSNFNTFKNACIAFFKNKNFNNENEHVDYIEISLNELTLENYFILEKFKPFGIGNPNPTFLIKNYASKSFYYSKDQNHIITPISVKSKIIIFNYKYLINKKKKFYNLYGKFSLNIFNNTKSLNFIVNKIN